MARSAAYGIRTVVCHHGAMSSNQPFVPMVVEIPRGSRNKYEIDHETGEIWLDLRHDPRPRRVDDVLCLVEEGRDLIAALVEPGRLLRRGRGDQRAVLPVHVGEPALVALAVIGAAPRSLGREVEVALANRLAVGIGPGFEELAFFPHRHACSLPGVVAVGSAPVGWTAGRRGCAPCVASSSSLRAKARSPERFHC